MNQEAEHNPGVEAIENIAKENGLVLKEKKVYTPKDSHARVLLVFTKQP